jgi:glyoxylase-like metal-dependent hydrolase (beta-lactamase superfamily II)
MAWQEVLPGSNAWFHEYDFYQAKHSYTYQANALAMLLNDHDLAIVSPPCGASEEDFAAIDAKGRVTALIASCGGHDAGQSQWQTRYPDAVPYAPTHALERLETFQRPFVPLSQLSAPRVEFQETPGAKSDEMIAITRGKRPVVFLGELLLDGNSLPNARFKFWLTGRAPGLRVNTFYSRHLGADRSAVARSLLDALEGDPAIVLAHGPPLVRPGDVARVRALLEPLASGSR